MLQLTSRRVHTAMRNYSRPSMMITTMIWLFALGAVSCKKHLPESQLCTCDVGSQGGEQLSKGGEVSGKLAICGVFDFSLPPNLDRATNIDASLGIIPYGTYTFAELLTNPTRIDGFFSTPVLEAYTVNLKYFFSASVNDLKGNPLVVIKDNKWFVYVENVGKYNYDANGFEVYDKAGHISLSFDFTPGPGTANLEVQGVVPTSSTTLEYYAVATMGESNLTDLQYGTPASDKFFEEVLAYFPIKPIFRYSGPGWQHARLPI
jgi:hypothetical protein